jgi:lysophospholipase L1-like esterase
MLPRFFKPEVAVANHAESGQSVASSTAARRLDKVLSLLRPGDWVLVQYGHNDMKSKAPNALAQYQTQLGEWVEKIRARGGTPVLITSMHRCSFQDGAIRNSLGDYPATVRQVAQEKRAPLVDLHAMSRILYEALGPDRAPLLFKRDAPGDPQFDHTHHNAYGAYELARCVVEGLRQSVPDLAAHLDAGVPVFDPAKPDDPDLFAIPASPGRATERPLGD